MANMMSRNDRLQQILGTVFDPARLEIVDESAKHAGHMRRRGEDAPGETHFNLLLVSQTFSGLSRVQRSRAVHEALETEFRTGLHALSLTLRTPEEEASASFSAEKEAKRPL